MLSIGACFPGRFSETAEPAISEKKLLLNRKDGSPKNINQQLFFQLAANTIKEL